MPLIPLELIKEGLRLVNNIIELNREDPTGTAKWVAAFWIVWPLFKTRVTPEQAKQIEELVKAIKPPEVVPAHS